MPSFHTLPGSGRAFHFRRKIGSGAFGEVYLAEMSTPGGFSKLVAVKLLKADFVEEPEILGRMRDEARMLGHLDHPSIVQADDLVFLAGRMAVIMEYVSGANLLWLINPRQCPEPLPPNVVLHIVRRVADALDTAWSRPSVLSGQPLRILHRDIKPSNIRITHDGEVKVLDFGVARAEAMERDAATQNQIIGSLTFVGPEVFLCQPLQPGSDIYALGVTFYESIARQRFGRCGLAIDQHAKLMHERLEALDTSHFGQASDGVRLLIWRMLDFDVANRPSAQEVVDRCRELEALVPGQPIEVWARGNIPRIAAACEADLPGEFVGHKLEEESTQTARARFVDQDPPTAPGIPVAPPAPKRSLSKLLIIPVLLALTLLIVILFLSRLERKHPTEPGVIGQTEPPSQAVATRPEPQEPAIAPEPAAETEPVTEPAPAVKVETPKAETSKVETSKAETRKEQPQRQASNSESRKESPPTQATKTTTATASEQEPLTLKVNGARRALRNNWLVTSIETGRTGCAVVVSYKVDGAPSWSQTKLSGNGPFYTWNISVTAEHRPAILYYVEASGCGRASHGSASSPIRVNVL